jgi:catechol 2,3-dioxygenase
MKLTKKIGHIGLDVADMDAAIEHATTIMGRRLVERTGANAYLSCNAEHHNLVFTESDRTALNHVSLEAESVEALEELKNRLLRESVLVCSEQPEEVGISQAIRFVGPSGHLFEVYTGMELDVHPARASGIDSLDPEIDTVGVRPRKFGHVALRAEDPSLLETFLSRMLGFIESDRVGGDLVWMRCNLDHHGLAILRGGDMLHHYAWEVESLAEIARLGDHLIRHGKTFIFGPGRHGPGRNYFAYHYDANGACVEYYADLEQIADDAWTGGDWAGNPNAINQWGPPPSEEFMSLGIPLANPQGAIVA